MAMLDSLPTHLPAGVRLCTTPADHLTIDHVHGYLGGFGRGVMDTWTGCHNRTTILESLHRLVLAVHGLVGRCVVRIPTSGSAEREYIEHIRRGMPRLQAIVDNLHLTYRGDERICAGSCEVLNLMNETRRKLATID